MLKKPISRLVFTFFAGSVLYASPFCMEQASAINNLMELFSKKSKPAPVFEAPVEGNNQLKVQDPSLSDKSQNKAIKKPNIEQIKRATIASPKPFDYKPERVVPIKFPAIDLIETNSTAKSSTPFGLPLSSRYNVILEGNASKEEQAKTEFRLADFSTIEAEAEQSIAEIVIHYYEQNPKLLWSQDGEVVTKVKDILLFFTHLDDDGLEPQDYLVKMPDENLFGEERQRALANFDVTLTSRILRYIQDASNGRIIADRLSPFHDLPRKEIDFAGELNRIAKSENTVAILQSYLPQSDYYITLKKALAELPEAGHNDNIRIAAQTVIKPGETNDNLPKFTALLLSRAPSGYLSEHKAILQNLAGEKNYNGQLVDAVKDYQKFVNKTADGIIGPSTIGTLVNSNVDVKRQKIINSMERLRWLPHDFGAHYVLINQAAYRAQYVENNEIRLDMKVVVGSPQRQTYFFYDRIRLVTFNPSWGVPNSIVVNEMLPRILQDSGYLQRNNYQLYDSSGKPVSASAVNWQKVASNGRGISIRQTPGKTNALGELKILFPNKHDIYLHDTPNKAAFSRDIRALSHGCVRLEYPREMAAAVLGKNVDDLRPFFAKGERSVSLGQPVPVYLAYFTAWPDLKTGRINYYDDVYSRDALMAGATEKTDSVRQQNM